MKSLLLILLSFVLLSATAVTDRDVQYHRKRAAQMRQQATLCADRAEMLIHRADSLRAVGDTVRAKTMRERADVELGRSLSYIRSAAREDDKAAQK